MEKFLTDVTSSMTFFSWDIASMAVLYYRYYGECSEEIFL